jgi:NAD(P)-dependent dehydrogenase (short-subunit alcohol dehydrogenase family)
MTEATDERQLSETSLSGAEAGHAGGHQQNESAAGPWRGYLQRVRQARGKESHHTGGDSGIGRAVAIAFAREGADLLIAYLSEDADAREVKSLIEKEGRKAVLVAGDLRDAAHCRLIVKRAVDELGGLDVLVNNAAHQATFKDIADISDEEWRMTFERGARSSTLPP